MCSKLISKPQEEGGSILRPNQEDRIHDETLYQMFDYLLNQNWNQEVQSCNVK